MNGKGGGHVIYVELVWENMKFQLNRQRLPMDIVATKVKEVMAEAELVLAKIEGQCMKGFALPISQNFIVAHFGDEVPSGQSVVIANLKTQKVYKYCLNDADTVRLMQLLGRPNKYRSVFPESVKNVRGVAKEDDPIPFFVFPTIT